MIEERIKKIEKLRCDWQKVLEKGVINTNIYKVMK